MTPAIIRVSWLPYDESTDDYADECIELIGTRKLDFDSEVVFDKFQPIVSAFENNTGKCVDQSGGVEDDGKAFYDFNLADYWDEDTTVPQELLRQLEAI